MLERGYMFGHWEMYDNKKKYTKPTGEEYTNKMFISDYPAAVYRKMSVYVYGNTIEKVSPSDYIRGINRISYEKSDEEAMMIATENEELKKTESSPYERIAAALEYIELLMM